MADKKKTTRAWFSPLFTATIKALWESGRFATVEEFKKFGDESFKRFPSLAWLKTRMSRDLWDKHKSDVELEERAAVSYSDLFEKEGMGDIDVVKRICLGIRAPERTIKAIVDYATANSGRIDDDTLKRFADAMNYDLRTATDYIAERNKMVGAYAASKHKVSGKLSFNDLSKMTSEEAGQEIERIHKNFVAAGICGSKKSV
jgi:hypothetical protein